MKIPKFKVGDKVKVLRVSTKAEHDLWGDSWVGEMNKNVGKVVTIAYIYCGARQKEYEYCKYRVEKTNFNYPEFVLQNPTKGQQLLFNFM